MSGIYGEVRFDGAPVTRASLGPLAAAMAEWGSDGHGQWCGESAGLGHVMLHVTPESFSERLPVSIRSAPHLIITADARIDNRDEVFDALGVPAAGRDRTPDSSLILLAFERWGADCVPRLLGDFAFAIWDSRERRLFCARDPFGCMPFVYRHEGARFVFASDVKGFLATVESPRLNEPMLAAYLRMRTYHAEKRFTFYEGIVKLPPSHTLTVTASGAQLSRYWKPEDSPLVRLGTSADYAERMRELFAQAVSSRLRSAFPVGAHLSGGLDSSAIAIVAARSLRERGQGLATFSWSPSPSAGAVSDPASEHARIAAVCSQEGLACEFLPVTKEDYFESFQRDITTEPTEMLARETKVQARAEELGLRVMLSGWGGDDAVSAHASGNGRGFLGMLRQRLPDSLYAMTGGNPWLEFESPCIREEVAQKYRLEVKALRGPAWRPRPDFRVNMCDRLEYGHLTRRIEHWAASGARRRVVYRYPMLDRRLVEFALGVPVSEVRAGGERRGLFLRAVARLVPTGFDWIRAKAEPAAHSAMSEAYIQAHSEWQSRLLRDARGVDNKKDFAYFVAPQKIDEAVQRSETTKGLATLSGVREAFGAYRIALRPPPNRTHVP